MAEETGLEAVVKLIQNLGLKEDLWRGYLGDALAKKVKDADLKEAGGRVKEFAGLSAEKIRTASQRNPKLFYSGLAAVVFGVGLMARAAREGADSADDSDELVSSRRSSGDVRGVGLESETEPRAAAERFDTDDDLAH